MSKLKKFDAKACCPKCGCLQVNMAHYAADDFWHMNVMCSESREHLDRTCTRCYYRWVEDVLRTIPTKRLSA